MKNLRILMSYALKYKKFTYLSLIISFLSGLLILSPLVFIFLIIRDAINKNYDLLTFYGFMAFIFAVLGILVYFCALMCSHISAFNVAANIRKKILNHISMLKIGDINKIGSGRIRQTIMESASSSETFLAHQLPDLVQTILIPLGLIVFMFVFDFRLGLVSLIPFALAVLVMFPLSSSKIKEDMAKYKDAMDDMSNEAVEYVRGIPVVKTFNQSVYSFKRLSSSITRYSKFCLNYTKRCRWPMILFLTFVNSVTCFLAGLGLILSGLEMTDSKFIINIIFYAIFTPMMSTLITKVMFIGENNIVVSDSLKRIDLILNIKPLEEVTNANSINNYNIKINNLSFKYNENDKYTLENINLDIKQNSMVAFIGPSGSGKSTLANLLVRFYDVNEGEILIGNTNIKDVRLDELNNNIAYVFQDAHLFRGSILDNLRLANENASISEVNKAIKDAQCEDIIEKLPDGINTIIGTKGIYLSGGERQRLAIARAFLKNAPIIILDEATAFADPENEKKVSIAFKNLSKNKTVIMIAHRLSSIVEADDIYILKDGHILDHGNHQELLDNSKEYNMMWQNYKKSTMWKVER